MQAATDAAATGARVPASGADVRFRVPPAHWVTDGQRRLLPLFARYCRRLVTDTCRTAGLTPAGLPD